jgi:hypothetical protein
MAEPTNKKRKSVRKPFSASKGYVDLKDAQVDTEGGTRKAPTATQKATGNYPMASSVTPRVSATAASGASAPTASRNAPSGNTDKWDGFASRYVPGQRDLLFGNPDIIVRDWLSQGKYKNNPQMAGDMSRYANIVFGDEQTGGLYELMTGGSLDPKVTGDDDMINYLASLLGEQSKVGGRSPSVQQMLGLLFEGFNNPDSTMGGLLKGGGGDDATTGQAINALMQYIPLLGEFTGNRRYADAMYRQATRLANEYQDMAVKGKNKGSFIDFMQDNYLT